MSRVKRFYCKECKRCVSRLQVCSHKYDVGYQTYTIDYRCKVCGNLVEETNDILLRMIKKYSEEEESVK